MSGIRERTSSGLAWSAANQVACQAAILFGNVVLSRLLTPQDFGLVATTLIFINFAVILAQSFGSVVIQKPSLSETHMSSIFWLNVAMGVLLTLALALGAPYVAKAYHEPRLTMLVRIVSVQFIISAFSALHFNLLARRLEFRRLAIIDVSEAWVGVGTAILLAWMHWGATSIAAQSITIAITGVATSWLMCEWRPKAKFAWSAIEEVADFSSKNLISKAADYWVRNVDNILIGLILGQGPLGIYTRAYAVMLFPLSRITRVVSRVMFPSFSLIQAEPERVKELFLRMDNAIALITFPMMLGVLATASDFTACVFGPQWSEVVPILRVLTVVGMVDSVTSLFAEVFLSRNAMGLSLRISLPSQALQILGIVVGLRWGILGVGVGYASMVLATAPFRCYFGGALIGLGLKEFCANLSGVLLSAVTMAAAVAWLGTALPSESPAIVRLSVEVAAGAAIYAALLSAFSVRGYREFLTAVRGRLRLS
ncbi:MAG: lipopolysaccharide biosynthesis protein [Elusimicrobia bacterium]|nr:lipopolysaccharide biosynthesis protein [Elusimicrobiota bacterium]